MKTNLGSKELIIYFCIWTGANIYSLYELYRSQNDILDEKTLSNLKDLKPGWKLLSRLQDVSDTEWITWKYFFFNSCHYFIVQFIISELLRVVQKTLVPFWYILSSVLFVFLFMGVQILIIICILPLLYSAIIFVGGKKKSVWLISIIILANLNYVKQNYYFWDYLDPEKVKDAELGILQAAIAWIVVRCISYSIDYIEINSKYEETNEHKIQQFSLRNLTDMLSYILYLPTLYMGPIILYEDFQKSFLVTNRSVIRKLKVFVWNMCIFMLYCLLMDFSLHYIYFLAMQDHIESIRNLPSMALCGGGLWMGLQFHMKYVISYGTAGAIVQLDNIEPPPTPRCIARIHIYSHMWKYFDVGLYRFLIKYIYSPVIDIIRPSDTPANIFHKLIAAIVIFMFIFLWHGMTLTIFVWSILNCTGIMLERLGAMSVNTAMYAKFREKILKTEQMEDRFKALVCTPLLAMSAVSNFFFFGGYDVGKVFFQCFTSPSLLDATVIAIFLNSCCHVSMALQDTPSRTDRRKQNSILDVTNKPKSIEQ